MLKWMQLRALLEAEGVNGGGSGDGAAGAGADAGGGSAGAADGGAGEGEGFTVAVDGSKPAEAGTGEGTASDPAKTAGEADTTGEGEPEKKDGEGEVKDEKKDDEPAFKPEDYKFTLPDGAEPDEAKAQEFTAFAIENKVPPEVAQKLVEFHAAEMQKQVKAWVDQVNGWAEQTRNDPEYGGAGYEENMSVANRALAEFGGPKLGEAARQYGWGNHPEFVRFMVNVGRAMGAPSTEKDGGQGNVATGIDRAKALYGH